MDDVIKQEVRSELTPLEKRRHVTAALNFLKGSKNFLIQYNEQIVKVVDVLGIRKKYQGFVLDKVLKFKEKILSTKDIRQKANNSFNMIMIGGMLALGGYLLFKTAINNINNEFKAELEKIDYIFAKGGNLLKRFDNYVQLITGRTVLGTFKYGITSVIDLSFKSILDLLVAGINLLLNGESSFYQGTPLNMVAHLMTKVALASMVRVLLSSNFMTMLSWFGFEMVKSIDKRAELSAYLRHGATVYKDVAKLDELARMLVNSDAYKAANKKWVDQAGDAVEEGDGSYLWDKFGDMVRLYHINIIQNVGAKYANDVHNGSGGGRVNPFDEKYKKFAWGETNTSVDVDWDFGFHPNAGEMYYADSSSIMYDANGWYKQAYNKVNQIISIEGESLVTRDALSLLRKVQKKFESQKYKLTVTDVGHILYVITALNLYENSRVITMGAQEGFTYHDIKGVSSLTYTNADMRRYNQYFDNFNVLKDEVVSGKRRGSDYLKSATRILNDYWTEALLLEQVANSILGVNQSQLKGDLWRSYRQRRLFAVYKHVLTDNTFDVGLILNALKRVVQSYRSALQVRYLSNLRYDKNPDGTVNYGSISSVNYVRSFNFSSRRSTNSITDTGNQYDSNGQSTTKLVYSLQINYTSMKERQLALRKERKRLLDLLALLIEPRLEELNLVRGNDKKVLNMNYQKLEKFFELYIFGGYVDKSARAKVLATSLKLDAKSLNSWLKMLNYTGNVDAAQELKRQEIEAKKEATRKSVEKTFTRPKSGMSGGFLTG